MTDGAAAFSAAAAAMSTGLPPTEGAAAAIMAVLEKQKKYEEEGEPSDNLYVTGLPKEFDTTRVQQFFGAIGNVVQCKSFGHGYALVRFGSLAEATNVKKSLHNQTPPGISNPLQITYALSEKKNDWSCPRCGDLQFQKNMQCRLCGCPRPTGDAEKDSATLASLPPMAEGGEGAADAEPAFGKAKGKVAAFAAGATGLSPYQMKGGKGGKAIGGPMCGVADFISELIVGGLPGGDFNPTEKCVYVGGLPADTTSENLYQIFATFGSIPPRGCRVDTHPDGSCSGFGFVNFMEQAGADMAVMALNGIVLNDGRTLEVKMNS